jgi:hypothetical protein
MNALYAVYSGEEAAIAGPDNEQRVVRIITSLVDVAPVLVTNCECSSI